MGEVNGIESWHIKKIGNGVTYGLSKTFFAKMERAGKLNWAWKRRWRNKFFGKRRLFQIYDDWVDDCKDIAFKAKAVFEEHIKQWSCKRMVRQLKKCYGICWNCGRPFTQSRTDQLFCSAKCRNKYRYTPVPRCKNCTAPDCAIREEQRAYAPKACPERNH